MQEIEQALTQLFTSNRVILLAAYGQVFFVLGLSVALQWRRESRLELARSMPLLAAFGFTQATAIWGDVFIPAQLPLLQPALISQLYLAQTILMLISFALLATFGVRLNARSSWMQMNRLDLWLQRIIWVGVVLAILLLVMASLRGTPSLLLRLRVEQLARPILIFGGAMAAAWGMRATAEEVQRMGLPSHIVSWLRVGGVALGIYAVFGGFFFPLQWPSSASYVNLWGVPVALPRLLAIGTLAWAMIQALTIFRLELQRTREEQGRLRALATDRERIGRDLHDGTIQAIYGAGLLLDSSKSLISHQPEAAEQTLSDAMRMLNQTIQDVRRYIFELSDGEGQLAEALGQLISELREQSGQAIDYRLEGTIPRYSIEVRSHLLQIAREAIMNALKHSGGDQVTVVLSSDRDGLLLAVTDNGRGLPPGGGYRPGGRGMANLRARANILEGELQLSSRPGVGTTVEVMVPHTLQIAR